MFYLLPKGVFNDFSHLTVCAVTTHMYVKLHVPFRITHVKVCSFGLKQITLQKVYNFCILHTLVCSGNTHFACTSNTPCMNNTPLVSSSYTPYGVYFWGQMRNPIPVNALRLLVASRFVPESQPSVYLGSNFSRSGCVPFIISSVLSSHSCHSTFRPSKFGNGIELQ